MRDIKFRAWDKELKKMWGWSNYFFCDTSKVTNYSGDFSDIEMPIMQYTGLKDKNGKEIYEGDIVSNVFDHKNNSTVMFGETGVTDYNGGGLGMIGFYCESESNCTALDSGIDNIEVIGNIYENPELLTKS